MTDGLDRRARGRLTSRQTPQGTLTYTYDAAGNLISTRSSNENGASVNYTYDAANRLATAIDDRLPSGSATTRYAYDANGNLATVGLPNAVATAYTYNALNRLTNLSTSNASATVASYAYTLGAAGNRLSVTERSGRTVAYAYDALLRLTRETITNDGQTNGEVGYGYDAVGNRLTRTSTLPNVTASTSAYDANDRLTSDTYDAAGNTVNANGNVYSYDFENRLVAVNGGAVRYEYDSDGHRVSKSVNDVTTAYLVDTNNPTGYAQVVDEMQGGVVTRAYAYGHDLISQRQLINDEWQASFYGYDGHGSVRYLTNSEGSVTDTYTYDAFGTLISRTGTTPNEYLYAGERFDSEAGMYHLRARYMNPASGRFWTQDSYEGASHDPLSLHKYLYANANPITFTDPSGHISIAEAMGHVQSIAIRAAVFALYSQRLHNTLNLVGATLTLATLLGGNDGDRAFVIVSAGSPLAAAQMIDDAAALVFRTARGTFAVARTSAALLRGSGPVPGVIEVSARARSTRILQNYYPRDGGIEFVFDPQTSTFVVGRPHVSTGLTGSPHERLVRSIGANESNVVGGIFRRGANGEVLTDEGSGHYGRHWNNETRARFVQFLEEHTGLRVSHSAWGN